MSWLSDMGTPGRGRCPKRRRAAGRVRAAAAGAMALALAFAATACSSPLGLPSHGLVQTMAPVERQDHRVYTSPEGPSRDAQPEGIVAGFIDAIPSGVQSDGFRVARQFLTKKAAQEWYADEGVTVYGGTPDFRRRANTMDDDGSIVVEMTLQSVGTLDKHGSYTPNPSGQTATMTFVLARSSGQWRIDDLPDGVAVASADFDQVFRQVSVYRVDAAGERLVPDVRWLSWRNWRTQAVREALDDAPAWLDNAVMDLNDGGTRLDIESVTVEDNLAQVRLDGSLADLDAGHRALLVRCIRLTLGDGNVDYGVHVTSSGEDYSDADREVSLAVSLPDDGVFTLTGGRVVSLRSSSPLRVAQTAGFADARGFVWTNGGGAVLRADGVAECLDGDGASCGAMFDGERLSSVGAGLDGEIWGVSADGKALVVSHAGQSMRFTLPWLGSGAVRALAVSPEGTRLALAIEGGAHGGVALLSVARGGKGMPSGVGTEVAQVSAHDDVRMLTFYNDLMLVYVVGDPENAREDGQHAYRQIVPGPDQAQRLPDSAVTAIASGQIALYRRLAVLDDLGIVRSVSGSLDGAWSIADSQVTALGAQ